VSKKRSFEEELFGDLNLQEEDNVDAPPVLTVTSGRKIISGLPETEPGNEREVLRTTGIRSRSALKNLNAYYREGRGHDNEDHWKDLNFLFHI